MQARLTGKSEGGCDESEAEFSISVIQNIRFQSVASDRNTP